jgi:hypothetical protein
MRRHRKPLPLILFLAAFLPLLASCSLQPEKDDPVALYDEAARMRRQNRLPEALRLYNRAIALDTAKTERFPQRAVDALLEKSRIEFLAGEYYEAFHTFGVIERHAGAVLPDSVHTGLQENRARMYAEIGNYGLAAEAMGLIRKPAAWQRFRQASFRMKADDWAGASGICGELAGSGDPAVRISALSGLLECSLSGKVQGLDAPDAYAGKIAAVSAKVISMQAEPAYRIRALRIAARSLMLLRKQHPNASYLLFRALAIAQEAGLAKLDQILQYESNVLIVRKPDVYRSVAEYFSQRNIPYARMAALFRLGMSPELTDAERIVVLEEAFRIGQYHPIPFTSPADASLEEQAAGFQEDLLIGNGRYFELFEASEKAALSALRRRQQASIMSFRLPAGHEALQAEIIELNREIGGLLQRKIDMVEEGTGFPLSAAADKAISRKRGRLIELEPEVAAIDRRLASRLTMEPVTMMTVQKRLKPDEALVRLFVRDSLATVMLIGSQEMQISSMAVPGTQVRSALDGFRQSLAAGGPDTGARLVADPWRVWLDDVLLQSLGDRLSGYRHLLFVADLPVPFHLLGHGRMLGEEQRVSLLGSAKEAVMYAGDASAAGTVPGISFFDASRPGLARVHKLFHPGGRVFLLWKPLPESGQAGLEAALQPMLKLDGSGSRSLHSMASGRGAGVPDPRWIWISSYGVD